jgi:hypothetical protein
MSIKHVQMQLLGCRHSEGSSGVDHAVLFDDDPAFAVLGSEKDELFRVLRELLYS